MQAGDEDWGFYTNFAVILISLVNFTRLGAFPPILDIFCWCWANSDLLYILQTKIYFKINPLND